MTLPAAQEFRTFHASQPLTGNPENALLDQPDDLILYLVAVIRNEPVTPPARPVPEWQAFFHLLPPHWILPLVAYNLRTWPETTQPPEKCMEYLEKVSLKAMARSMLAERQIKTVTAAMKEAGIPVLLIKGPALARTVYPDPMIRQSADIDLLIQPQHVLAAENVLENLGYTSPSKKFHHDRSKAYDEKFIPGNNGYIIELHWAADYAFNLSPEGGIDAIFQRKIPVRSGELSCDTMSPPDHLVYLAFHNMFHHTSVRLDWLYDVSLLLGTITTPEEWKELGRLSVEHNVRIPMELQIRAACLWTGCRLPGGSTDFSAWPAASEREAEMTRFSEVAGKSLSARMRLHFRAKSGILEKTGFILHLIFPPTPMLAIYRRSDSALDIPAAYVRRWIRIIRMI